MWRAHLSGLEVIHLLSRLEAGTDDLDHKNQWWILLVESMRSLIRDNLSSHCWGLLDELVSARAPFVGAFIWVFAERFEICDVEVVKSLEEAEDREKLEVWMATVWGSLLLLTMPMPELMEVFGDVTLKLILLRPSAFRRCESLCERVFPEGVETQRSLRPDTSGKIIYGAPTATVYFCSFFPVPVLMPSFSPSAN